MKKKDVDTPPYMNGNAVDRVASFKFPGTFSTWDLIWTFNTSVAIESYFSTTLSWASHGILVMYKSISAADTEALQRFLKTAERLTASLFTTLNNIFTSPSLQMSCYALKVSSHPANQLLQLLPSGKHTDPLKQAPHDSWMPFCFTPEP